MQSGQPHRIGRVFGALVSVAFVVFSLWLFLNRQAALDHFMVWQNPASSQMVVAADRAGLDDNGKFLLYASIPKVQPKQNFNASCNDAGKETAVLGCYSMQRIYVLDVTDQRLDGIEEVTLAHEMLHAAYERLTRKEKSHVDAMLEEQFAKSNDQHIKDLVQIYAKTEPGEKYNELHSILATEVDTLNVQLEEYYKKYFTDRSQVVKLYKNYSVVFDQLKQQQQALVDDLNNRTRQINEAINSYNDDAEQLANDIRSFNDRADTYTSQASFNRDRQVLVSRQAQLKEGRELIDEQIDQYNLKKKELDQLNVQAAQLNQSINSRIDEAPSL